MTEPIDELRDAADRLRRDAGQLARQIEAFQSARGSLGQDTARTNEEILCSAIEAVDLFEKQDRPPRPPHLTIKQAAEKLGLSRRTVSTMLKTGQFRLNRCGRIPIEQIDMVLSSRWTGQSR